MTARTKPTVRIEPDLYQELRDEAESTGEEGGVTKLIDRVLRARHAGPAPAAAPAAAAPPVAAGPKRRAAPAMTLDTAVDPGCAVGNHPPSRRVGKFCMACGKEVGGGK